jgi:hypothetical protein
VSFDIFELDHRVAGEYRDYVTSFVQVREPRLRRFVEDELARGRLWPEPILELNPAFERTKSLGELARDGVIRPETARFFGEGLVLMRHQEEAIRLATSGRSVIVSTGTGSGKSLTYLVPMVDAAFRAGIEKPGVVGLCVYPMNALVGSQLEALQAFQRKNWQDCPLRFARWTGQDRDTALRNEILGNPPHLLLTNYVMLELALVRPSDRTLVQRMVSDLALLAVDELHVYRGRQEADVAMLLRRLRERIGRDPVCIGTSATIASEGDREARKAVIARVGARLFGVPIGPDEVVGESLVRRCRVAPPEDAAALRAAIEGPPPEPRPEALASHPLAAWVESRFGVAERGGRLERARPLAFDEGVRALAEASGLEPERCAAALRAVLQAGARTAMAEGPFFAFRLHRFFSSGASFYATLEPAERRHLQAEPAHRLPGEPLRLLAPLAFCRTCGQDFYLVARTADGFQPRSAELDAPAEETGGEPGFLVAAEEGFWDPEEDGWPDDWLEWRNGRERPRPDYEAYRPERLFVTPDGRASLEPREGALPVLWQKRPFMICPNCRTSFDRRFKRDFGKLVTLAQIGRSTASTVLAAATVRGLRALSGQGGRGQALELHRQSPGRRAPGRAHQRFRADGVGPLGPRAGARARRTARGLEARAGDLRGARPAAHRLDEDPGRIRPGLRARPPDDGEGLGLSRAHRSRAQLAGDPAEPRGLRTLAHRLRGARRAPGRRCALARGAGARSPRAGGSGEDRPPAARSSAPRRRDPSRSTRP